MSRTILELIGCNVNFIQISKSLIVSSRFPFFLLIALILVKILSTYPTRCPSRIEEARRVVNKIHYLLLSSCYFCHFVIKTDDQNKTKTPKKKNVLSLFSKNIILTNRYFILERFTCLLTSSFLFLFSSLLNGNESAPHSYFIHATQKRIKMCHKQKLPSL